MLCLLLFVGDFMITIRLIEDGDWDRVWPVIKPVFRSGESYPYPIDICSSDAFEVWVTAAQATYVAVDQNGAVLGTYYLKANQPGLGGHVANCGYIVGEGARGQGIASKMCVHSQAEAVKLGFRAMQYNLVVSTNVGAVQLWERHGFERIGVLRGAFHHLSAGYVDAYVMYKTLVE